jgi:hypothetical protein
LEEKVQKASDYLYQNKLRHLFFFYGDKGDNSDLISKSSPVKIFQSNGIFIYINKLQFFKPLKTRLNQDDFNILVEYYVRYLSSKTLSTSDKAKKFYENMITKCGKNIVTWIVKKSANDFILYVHCTLLKFRYHIEIHGYDYGACSYHYYSNKSYN